MTGGESLISGPGRNRKNGYGMLARPQRGRLVRTFEGSQLTIHHGVTKSADNRYVAPGMQYAWFMHL
jgi:hypothetical protein